MWTAFVFFIESCQVFPKRVAALLANESHFCGRLLSVIAQLEVTFTTIEPSIATWRLEGNLELEMSTGMHQQGNGGSQPGRWECACTLSKRS